MHGYARGIAGILAAGFIWSTGYAVPSVISLQCKELPVANPMTFGDVMIIVQ